MFDGVLTDAAERALGKTRIEAEAFTRVNARKYWNWVARQRDDDIRAGLNPCFSLTDPGLRRCAWLPWTLSQSANANEQRLAVLLRSRPQIQTGIDALDEREYEAMGCLVCDVIGASHLHLTPRGNEGGMDFLAILEFSFMPHVFKGMRGAILIVGQCKKYAEPVQVDRVEQFIKTVENVRHRAPRVTPHLPPWFHDCNGPIVGWMIAHNGVQVGGRDEAKQHGVVLSDSRDLAEIVACAESFHGADAPPVRSQRMRDRALAFL